MELTTKYEQTNVTDAERLRSEGYFEVESFHSEFVVALVVMVKFISLADISFFATFGKSD